jgi:hypothetical protein
MKFRACLAGTDKPAGILSLNLDPNFRIILDEIQGSAWGKTAFQVEFTKIQKTRSEQANALFHALRDKIADHTGGDPEQVKQELKFRYGVKFPVDHYPGNFWLKSTSDYTWEEFAKLIDGVFVEAGELGVRLTLERAEFNRIEKG